MSAPKKILLIAYEYPPLGGGTGKAVMNTARELVRLGFDVAVLTSAFGDLPREESQNGALILRIPVLRRYLNYANSIEVLSFAASGWARLRGLRAKFQPDLTLAYHTIPSGIVAWRLRAATGAPFITLLRGQDVPGYPEVSRLAHRLAWPITSLLWKRSLRVIANSQGLAALAHESAPNLRIDVVHNGIDLELYRPMDGIRPADDLLRVTYTGRLIRKKRIRELVEAFALLPQPIRESSELCIAGFGPEREPLEALAQNAGIGLRVRFLGRLDEPAVVKLLQSSDIFVNLAEGEGLPNAVLEAMACGLPTVLSDIQPHRELIGEGKAGHLSDGTPPNISASLEKLLSSAELRKSLGNTARRITEEQFSWERNTKRLIELFPNL